MVKPFFFHSSLFCQFGGLVVSFSSPFQVVLLAFQHIFLSVSFFGARYTLLLVCPYRLDGDFSIYGTGATSGRGW
jgi:hypothetical protein